MTVTKKAEYKTLSVAAARTGWIVKETGRPAEIFVRWESVVNYLESQLTTKSDEHEAAKEMRRT